MRTARDAVKRDGDFILGFYKEATIPLQRRQAGMARLAAVAIKSSQDLDHLQQDLRENPARYQRNRSSRKALFLPKYEYMSF